MEDRYNIKNTFVVVFLLIALTYASAQNNYNFKKFADSDKLSSVLVADFFQDSYGFMWLTTADGLNRYDGKNVKIYRNQPGDDNSLPENDTYAIIEDKQKNLWVACYNVIGKLNRKTDKFKRYSLYNLPFKRELLFYGSLLDKEGRIWFTSSQLGVIRYNKEKDYFENIELSKKNKNTVWGTVNSIIQLKNGVILAADFSNGLKKYNSKTNKFEPYNLKPDYSPKKIAAIHESKTGNIWFGGDNVLIKYSPSQYVFTKYNMSRFSKIKSNYHQILAIVEDDEDNLWVSQQTHGLLKLSKKLNSEEQFVFKSSTSKGVMENAITNLYKDKYGIIWLSFLNGGVQQLDLNANSFSFIPLNIRDESFNNQAIVASIESLPSNKSKLIFGTTTEGIVGYDFNAKKFSRLDINNNAVNRDSNITITALKIDDLGNIWFASKNSFLKRLDRKTGKISLFKPPYYKNITIPFNIVSINFDSNGDIWLASNLGIDKFTLSTGKFVPIPRLMNKGVDKKLKSLISNIAETRKPFSSILRVGDGVNLDSSFVLEKKQKVLLISLGEGKSITKLMYDYGSLSRNDGKIIWTFDKLKDSFYAGGGFKNRLSFKCLELEKGKYKLHYTSDMGHYFGNFNTVAAPDSNWWGIQAFTISDSEFDEIKNLNNKEINKRGFLPFELGRFIEFSKKYSNTIWIGTYLNSFFKYDLANGNFKQYNFDSTNISNGNHFTTTIYEDLDGVLWVGTYSSLIRLNPETNKLNIFNTADGIPGGIIYSIVEDNLGALWISSSGGLSKLNKNAPIDKYVFVNYDSKDGLESLSKNYNSVWKDEDGRIYFGAKGGIISFVPGNANVTKPDIVVSDLKINDVSCFTDSSQVHLEQSIYDSKLIDLAYYQNNISFEFASIHFSRPAKNRTAYKLEGFEKKWYESDRDFASFTNLDPGEYIFKVKGSNGDGVWNETVKKIKIVISPPWWKTTSAYIAYGLFFILGLVSIDRFQRRRLLAKAREKMKFQEAEHRAETAELQAKAAEAQSKLIQIENERKTKELEEARQLQLSMLPKELPKIPNLDIAVYMQTATEVGGDYYDFHVGMDGTLTVVVGDATGHGLNAGTIVTATKSLFNSYASNPDILFTFSEISRCIKGLKFRRLSMCLSLLKIEGDNLRMSSAGMPPVLIYRDNKKELEEIMLKGMPLGTTNKFPYELSETTLGTGDTILLSSDGFPELFNEKKEMFGYDRVKETFTEIADRSSEKIITHLKETAEDWTNGKAPDDDVTFVVLKMK